MDIGLSSSRRVDSIAFSARIAIRSSYEHIPGLDFARKSLCLFVENQVDSFLQVCFVLGTFSG